MAGFGVRRVSDRAAKRRKLGRAVVPASVVVLWQAMQAHQEGDMDTAQRLYEEVLTLRTAQPDALHYLGVLCHQRGAAKRRRC